VTMIGTSDSYGYDSQLVPPSASLGLVHPTHLRNEHEVSAKRSQPAVEQRVLLLRPALPETSNDS
jgi:hypothetical protein